MEQEDIIRRFLRIMVDEVPAADTNAVLRIERRLRLEWGGQRPYVPKRVAEWEWPPNKMALWRWGKR